MKKINYLIIGIILIMAIIIGITNTGFLTLKENDNIKIGAMLYLSGEGSSWGDASYKGIELAVKEINEKGGINGKKIKVVYQDTKGDLKETLAIYKKFRDIDRVTAIIGPNFQSELNTIYPLLKEDKMPVIAPSYMSKENRTVYYNPLLIWQDPSLEAEIFAEYIFYDKNIKKIAIISTKDSWENEVSYSFKDKFEKIGGEVVYFQQVNPYENDISTEIIKLINKKPDAVFIASYYIFLDSIKKLNEMNYSGKLFSIEVDEYLAYESKNYSNNLIFISPDLYIGNFTEKYFKVYNEKPTIPAGQAYDSAKILFSIFEKTTNKEEIILNFSKLKEYNGASGKIKFENEKTKMPLAIYKITNGEIEKIKEIK